MRYCYPRKHHNIYDSLQYCINCWHQKGSDSFKHRKWKPLLHQYSKKENTNSTKRLQLPCTQRTLRIEEQIAAGIYSWTAVFRTYWSTAFCRNQLIKIQHLKITHWEWGKAQEKTESLVLRRMKLGQAGLEKRNVKQKEENKEWVRSYC